MTSLNHQYTVNEELANAISHGIGLLLSLFALGLMTHLAMQNQDLSQLVSAITFGSSLILLFLASTLYHCIPSPALKQKLKLLDHCAIYLLIAGTYTPFMLLSIKGVLGFSLLALVWLMALAGVFFKIYFQQKYPKLSLFTYLLMGWIVVIAAPQMLEKVPTSALVLLTCGGLAYTLGAVFYAWRKLTFNHAIWHVFVLAGSTCHFLAVYLFLMKKI